MRSGPRIALYNVTTTTRVGGVESFVWEVAARLAERGYSVDVIGGRGQERRDYPGVTVVTLPYIDRETLRRLPLIGRDYTFTKLLERLSFGVVGLPYLIAHRYKIVHIQKPYDLPVGALARPFGQRLLFGCHGKDFWMGDRFWVRFANGAVAASAFNAEQVRERYAINPVVIYNGVDTTRFNPTHSPDEPAMLNALGLSGDLAPGRHNVLWVGRLVRWKGFEYMVEALALLKTSNVRVWVAGSGSYQADLEALAARLGVSDRIRFLGSVPQEQLPALYHAADLVAGTSFVNETFGIALCEAMACGRPVVASRFGGFAEVVDDGVTGLLAPPQDPAALAAAMDRILGDPELAAHMGAAGPERINRLFTWDAVVDRLEPVYKYMLAAPNPQPLPPGGRGAAWAQSKGSPINRADSPSPGGKGLGVRGGEPANFLYVAYTLSLTLKAANAVQTFQTVRQLVKEATPDQIKLVVPRWLGEESRFGRELGRTVTHLPRIPFNKLTRFFKSSVFSYIERTAFSAELLAWIMWRRATGRRFDAIYVRDVVCAYWLLKMRRLVGSPVIYEAHDLEQTNPSRARGALWRRWLASLDRVALTKSARVVSLTAAFRDYLAQRRIRKPSDVAVIADAFDDASYGGLGKSAARGLLGLPEAAFVVGYAGLTFAYRRLDLLVDAFAAMPDDGPAILVLVGGRPGEVEELKRQAKDLGLAVVDRPGSARRQVLFTGQIDGEGVVPWLYAADVLAIPDTVSTTTASPLKLFEYMAAGRAIVLRELPALREILDDESAVFFPPGDAKALSDALTSLRRDPALRDRLGAAAKARSEQYTYRERARRVLAVLRGVSS